jgi:hypothetical protein
MIDKLWFSGAVISIFTVVMLSYRIPVPGISESPPIIRIKNVGLTKLQSLALQASTNNKATPRYGCASFHCVIFNFGDLAL